MKFLRCDIVVRCWIAIVGCDSTFQRSIVTRLLLPTIRLTAHACEAYLHYVNFYGYYFRFPRPRFKCNSTSELIFVFQCCSSFVRFECFIYLFVLHCNLFLKFLKFNLCLKRIWWLKFYCRTSPSSFHLGPIGKKRYNKKNKKCFLRPQEPTDKIHVQIKGLPWIGPEI